MSLLSGHRLWQGTIWRACSGCSGSYSNQQPSGPFWQLVWTLLQQRSKAGSSSNLVRLCMFSSAALRLEQHALQDTLSIVYV